MDDRTTTEFLKTLPVDVPGARRTAPKKRRGTWLLLFIIAAAGAGWWYYGHQTAPVPQQPAGRQSQFGGAMPVVVAPAVTGDIDITLNALGTVTSMATVTIRSQISGYLVRVAYEEGQVVKKGDLLAEIDSRPYELALQNAQGALERDQAMLQSAELDLKRYQDLAKTNAIPRQQLDQQVALVAQDRGNVLSDRAQIDTQKLNITYTHITAPVNGRVGLRLVDQGNYVTPGDATGLVVITQIMPITVIFPVPEDNLPQIMKRLAVSKSLPVTAYDRSGTTKLSLGALKTLDNQIDTTTGTLKLRAEFANEDNALFPNQFVNVQLLVDTLHDVTVMPTSAIQRGAPGTFVYLLGSDNTVTVKPVTLGASSGERVAVLAGLSPGDRVVIDGADKLRNGARVVPRDVGGAAIAGGGQPSGGGRERGARGAAAAAAAPENAAPAKADAASAAAGNPPEPGRGGNGGGRRSRGAPSP